MGGAGGTVFAVGLTADAASVVVSLVLVVLFDGGLGTGVLGHGPSWEILFS